MLDWLTDHWIWVTMFVVGCALEGIWVSLREGYGPSPIKGWRDWHRYCDESDARWAAILELSRRKSEREGTELPVGIRTIEGWHHQCLDGADKFRDVTDSELLETAYRPVEDWRPYGPPKDELPRRIGRKVGSLLRRTRRALMRNSHQRIR